jgi:hypothetical protein
MKTVSLATGTTPPTHVEPVVQLPLAWEYFFVAKDVVATSRTNEKITNNFNHRYLEVLSALALKSLDVKKWIVRDIVINQKSVF